MKNTLYNVHRKKQNIWKPLTQHCRTAESKQNYDKFIRLLETVVQGQAISLHGLSWSLWWWPHLLRPSQIEIAPLKPCCLNPVGHTGFTVKPAHFINTEMLMWPSHYRMEQGGRHVVWYATSNLTAIGHRDTIGFWCDKRTVLHFLLLLLEWYIKVFCIFFNITKSQFAVSSETSGAVRKRAWDAQVHQVTNTEPYPGMVQACHCRAFISGDAPMCHYRRWGQMTDLLVCFVFFVLIYVSLSKVGSFWVLHGANFHS